MMEEIEKDGDKKSNGGVFGIVVILLVLIIGGIWFWKQNRPDLSDNRDTMADELGEATADEIIFEDEINMDEILLDDDLTTYDEVGNVIQ